MIDFNYAPIQLEQDNFYIQRTISKELFFASRDNEGKHRKVFSENSGLQLRKAFPTFSISFGESILPILYEMTGIQLAYSHQYHNFWTPITEEEKRQAIESWVAEQGHRVFLRDLLFSSIALGMNKDGSQNCTTEGRAFRILKYNRTDESIDRALDWTLKKFCETIQALPFYKTCRYICAVPARRGKVFDLPSALARAIASRLQLTNITDYFSYLRDKPEAKNASRDEKWDALEQAGLVFDSSRLTPEYLEQDVILIDDLYQSGVTVNFVGMKLQQAGFNRICGLYLVKSMNDSDNVSSRTGS